MAGVPARPPGAGWGSDSDDDVPAPPRIVAPNIIMPAAPAHVEPCVAALVPLVPAPPSPVRCRSHAEWLDRREDIARRMLEARDLLLLPAAAALPAPIADAEVSLTKHESIGCIRAGLVAREAEGEPHQPGPNTFP